MRYILNDNGFIQAVSFNNLLECQNKTCTEYTGTVPTGYENLAIWSETANINAYKIVNGNLRFDSEEDARLQSLWASQKKGTVNDAEILNIKSDSTTDTYSCDYVNNLANEIKNTPPVRKLLFSNTSNTDLIINLNDSVYNYSYLYVEGDTATYNVMIPIYSASQTAFRGIGGWSGEENVGSSHAQGAISNSGKTMTFGYFKSIVHNSNSNHTASTNRNIRKIIGVR